MNQKAEKIQNKTNYRPSEFFHFFQWQMNNYFVGVCAANQKIINTHIF